jgi:hypothetical protein
MKTTNAGSIFAKVLAALFTFGTLFAYVGWKHRELSGVTAGVEGTIPAPASVVTTVTATTPSKVLPPPVPASNNAQSEVLTATPLALGSTKSYSGVVSPQSVLALMEPTYDLLQPTGTIAVSGSNVTTTAVITTQPSTLHLMGTKSGAVVFSPPPSSQPLHMGSTKSTAGVFSAQQVQTVVNPTSDPLALAKPQASAVSPAITDKHPENTEDVPRLLKTGLGYFDLGQFENAYAIFNKILAIDPHNVAARRQLERTEHEIDKVLVPSSEITPKVQQPTLHLGSTKSIVDPVFSTRKLQTVVNPAPDPLAPAKPPTASAPPKVTPAPLTMPSTKSLQIVPIPAPDASGAKPTAPAKQSK